MKQQKCRHVLVPAISCCLMLILLLGFLPGKAEAGSWDTALNTVDGLYDSVSAMDSVIKLEKQNTQVLRKSNDAVQKAINESVKNIDKSKLTELKAAADQAEKKYAPLLADYANLGKQITAAKKNKDKKTADLLDLKRNRLKPSVDAAKLEIKNKKAALSAAKQAAAAKTKLVKDALAPVTVLRKQITEENKLIAASNKSRAVADKLYKSAVKQGNAVTAAAELTIIYGELGKVHSSQQKIYSWEKQITSVLTSAKAKLPK